MPRTLDKPVTEKDMKAIRDGVNDLIKWLKDFMKKLTKKTKKHDSKW